MAVRLVLARRNLWEVLARRLQAGLELPERSVSIGRRKWMWSRMRVLQCCSVAVSRCCGVLGNTVHVSRTYLGIHARNLRSTPPTWVQWRWEKPTTRRGRNPAEKWHGREVLGVAQHRPELHSRANPVPCAMGRSIWTFHEDSGDRGRVATEPIASRRRPQMLKETNSGGRTAGQTLRWTETPQSSDAVPPEIQIPRCVSWAAQVIVGYYGIYLFSYICSWTCGRLGSTGSRPDRVGCCCAASVMGSGGREGSGELWPRLCHPNLSSRWRDRRPPLSSQCIRASEGAEYHRTGRANRLITLQLRRTETRPMLSPGVTCKWPLRLTCSGRHLWRPFQSLLPNFGYILAAPSLPIQSVLR